MDKFSVIILAGGNSSRFGKPKPFLLFDKYSSFLEKIVRVYLEFGCQDIVIVMNQHYSEILYSSFSELFRTLTKVVYNSKPEMGRFYSLKLGADSVSNSDFCFIQNIDNPFTDIDTLQKLYDNRKNDSYISPVYLNSGGHPILMPQMIIDKIRGETNIDLDTKDFLSQFNKVIVSVDNDKILANINTPEDYEIYFNQFAQSLK